MTVCVRYFLKVISIQIQRLHAEELARIQNMCRLLKHKSYHITALVQYS